VASERLSVLGDRAAPPVDHLGATRAPGARRRPVASTVVLLSVLSLGLAGAEAILKPLGYDELFTVYLARLGPSELWAALRSGADLLPPLGYVLTGAVVRAFGEHSLVIRLPAILGFWLMGLGLFVFVTRRTSPLIGALALLFPLAAPAQQYAVQARPYGLVLGFAALALVAWRAVAERRSRCWSALGLTAALIGATSSHYYGVLVGLPLALGESIRSSERRQVDPLVWAAVAVGAAPLVVFRPLMSSAYAYAPHFWGLRHWSTIWATYVVQVRPVLLTLVAGAVVLAVLRRRRQVGGTGSESGSRWPAHEQAAVLGFLLLPVVAASLALALGAGFATRYALPVVIGVSVVFAGSMQEIVAGRKWAARLLALALAGWILGNGITQAARWREAARTARGAYPALQASAIPADLIVVTEPMAFLPLLYGAPDDLARRLVYLADPGSALRAVGTDTLDRALGNLAQVAPVRVEPYRAFLQTHGAFFVWEPPGHFGWARAALTRDGISLEVRTQDDAGVLLRAVRHD